MPKRTHSGGSISVGMESRCYSSKHLSTLITNLRRCSRPLKACRPHSTAKKLSELTLRGAMNNGMYSSGGTAPYGYRRIAVNLKTGQERKLEDGQWIVKGQEKAKWAIGRTEEVEIVRWIYEERSRGKAYVLIAQALNQRGVPCPKRGRWKNKNQKWGGGTVKTILENPAYRGARSYNRNSMSKIIAHQMGRGVNHDIHYPHWLNGQDKWIVMENAHEPIVSRDLWERANTRIRSQKAQHPRGPGRGINRTC